MISAVTSLAGRWKDLGISLGVRAGNLDTILANNPNSSSDRLREVLALWLRQSYNVCVTLIYIYIQPFPKYNSLFFFNEFGNKVAKMNCHKDWFWNLWAAYQAIIVLFQFLSIISSCMVKLYSLEWKIVIVSQAGIVCTKNARTFLFAVFGRLFGICELAEAMLVL